MGGRLGGCPEIVRGLYTDAPSISHPQTLQFFLVAEVILIINAVNLASVQLTLLRHPQSSSRPLDSLFIYAPMSLLFVVLFSLDWLHNGLIALGWLAPPDAADPFRYTWQATLALLAVNLVVAAWIALRLDVYATAGVFWLLLCVLLGRTPKPTVLVVTIIVLLVLHPVILLASYAFRRTRDKEGRIRLEEEAQGGSLGDE